MNRNTTRLAAAALAAGFVLAPATYAQTTPNTGEQRAQEAAKKGPAELRRFVQRTRMIYGLNFNDYYKE